MKRHTHNGFEALRRAEVAAGVSEESPFLRVASEIALSHHERWDGSGYPQGLAEEDIPVSGRLMALADVYDALTSKRCYKPPMSHEEATAIIVNGKGGHFDPDMVDAFLDLEDEFRAIAREYADSE